MAGKSKNDKTIVLDIQVRYGEAIGKITECKKQIDELNKSNNELKKQLKEGEISQKEFTKAVDANKASISLYNKEIKTLKDEIRNNVATQLLFENNLKSLRGQIENTDNALKSLNNSLQESAKRRELEQTLQSLRTEFSNTQSASLSFQANIGDYNNISAEALEALKNIDSNTQNNNLYRTTSLVISLSSNQQNVYLPSDAYRGTVIWLKQWSQGYIRIYPPNGQKLYDDSTENSYIDVGEGYMAMCIFIDNISFSSDPDNRYGVWLLSKFKF
ncbi:MAG: hypothetical protein ACLVKO_09235 [Dysgonomonas sp.]